LFFGIISKFPLRKGGQGVVFNVQIPGNITLKTTPLIPIGFKLRKKGLPKVKKNGILI